MRGIGSGGSVVVGASTDFPLRACEARDVSSGSALRTGTARFSPSRTNVRRSCSVFQSMHTRSPRCQQIRQRIDNVTLNRALEVACAVALVGAFLQQEVAALARNTEEELALSRFQHALLDLAKLDFQNLFQLLATQWMKDHHLIKAVHKFR